MKKSMTLNDGFPLILSYLPILTIYFYVCEYIPISTKSAQEKIGLIQLFVK